MSSNVNNDWANVGYVAIGVTVATMGLHTYTPFTKMAAAAASASVMGVAVVIIGIIAVICFTCNYHQPSDGVIAAGALGIAAATPFAFRQIAVWTGHSFVAANAFLITGWAAGGLVAGFMIVKMIKGLATAG
ncbi:MAG: hypothetical protein H0X51_02100 [Parachlamydiaceae bacterium]|nr:hypothetical protein [Parachlamydiaceae bacterium]